MPAAAYEPTAVVVWYAAVSAFVPLDSVGSPVHPDAQVGPLLDWLPTTPNSSSRGWDVVDVEPELKLEDDPEADADWSRLESPANSSTLIWYRADFENLNVIVAPDASAFTPRADSTSMRSPLPDVFWSRSIE